MSPAPGSNALAVVTAELGELVAPLREALADDNPPHALVALLHDAGWRLPGVDDGQLAAVTAAWSELFAAVDALPQAVRTDDLLEVAAGLVAIASVVDELGRLHEALVEVFETVAADPGAVASALADDLVRWLTLRWLARRLPVALGVLRALRIVRAQDAGAIPAADGAVDLRRASRRAGLDPGALLDLLRDPVGTLGEAYAPASLAGSRDAQALNLALATRLGGLALHLGGELHTLWPWEDGVELTAAERAAAHRTSTLILPLPAPDGEALLPSLSASAQFLSAADRGVLGRAGPGVEVGLDGLASLSGTRGAWTVELLVAATAGQIMVTSEAVHAEAGATVAADLTLTRDGSGAAPIVIGSDRGTRLELGTPTIRAGVELAGVPDVSFELTLADAALVVTAGDGDSFVAAALAAWELRADFDLGLVWSRSAGLRLAGGVGLTLQVPIGRDLGGVVFVDSVDATLELGDADLGLSLGVHAELSLGPFTARIDGIGLRTVLEFPTDGRGNLGFADLELGFLPPTGFGLELALEAASGGGYVWIDPATGRYAGALELEFVAVGLDAVVVVDTQLPGDPDGWALFASLSLTFPSVPLGFGFFLSGLGGIVALNRTLDVEALAAGLKSGAVDAILFPEDVLAETPFIVSQLDAWFPLAEGSAVFGVSAIITWGTPKVLITGELGIALSFPDLDLAVLGAITIELPDAETALLELHMDTLGAIDTSERTILIAASLHDSSLLRVFQLSGDMAMYGRFTDDPYFLLSVGGFHPDFEPPGGLPASVIDLDRMRVDLELSEDVWFALETYLAVTSNSLQFGAQACLEASAPFLGVTYTARGAVGFDVLLVFSPFSFSAGLFLSVSVTSGSRDRELLAVDLSAHLEGPQPWYATGRAHFEFFGLGVSFEVEVGGAARAVAPPRTNVLDAVLDALAAPASWRGRLPAGADANGVTLAADALPEGEAWVHPGGEVEARQTAAPLDRTLDHYGIYAIDGPARLDVEGAGLGVGESAVEGVEWETVLDWFAPAQYDDMTRSDKLDAPSYESMVAGVRFGTQSVSVTLVEAERRTVLPTYETRILDKDAVRDLGIQGLGLDLLTTVAGLGLDARRRARAGRSATSVRFAVGPTTWSTADAATGAGLSAAGTYRDALEERRAAIAANPTARGAVRVAPTHAVLGAR